MDIKNVKDYWNKRPCNIQHSKKDIGSIEYFNDVENRKYLVEPHIPVFAEFNKWKGKKVLEIGCGIGTDSINFARAGAILTCVELSDVSLDLCEKRFKEFNLFAKFYSGNCEELSKFLPIEEYDLIYSFGVIHHTPNPELVYNEIKKYMNKDTEIRLMLYARNSWKTIEFFIRNGHKFKYNLKKTIQYYAEAQLNCPVAFTYTKKEIKKMFKDFEIIELKKTHIFPYIVDDYIKHIYKKKLIFRLMPKKLFSILESVLGWHFLIKLKNK